MFICIFHAELFTVVFLVTLYQSKHPKLANYAMMSVHHYVVWKKMFLFNDALNTFYLRLYGVGHMEKDHSDSERGNPLPPHGLLFPIRSKGSFIYTPSHKQDRTYHGLYYSSRGALAGTRNSSLGLLWRIDPTTHRTMSERSYHGASSRSYVGRFRCYV